MLGPHILGGSWVTFSRRAINSWQSSRCCSLALEAMYPSTLASVGLVLFSAIESVRDCRVLVVDTYRRRGPSLCNCPECNDLKSLGLRSRRVNPSLYGERLAALRRSQERRALSTSRCLRRACRS